MQKQPQSIHELSELLEIRAEELTFFARTIDRNVYVRKKPKPTGGTRTITAPNNALKELLRRIDKSLLSKIPLHQLLYLKPKSSYVQMLKKHVGRRCLLTADIDDFYPSIKITHVKNRLIDAGLSNEVASLITRLTTLDYSLPQGFPTSSKIAGIVLQPVMTRIEQLAKKSKLKAGIYADNLAISADYDPGEFRGLVKRVFLQSGYKLDKFKIVPRENTQEIMNVNVNREARVKQERIRNIQKEIRILAKVSREFSNQEEIGKRLRRIRGLISSVNQINTDQATLLRTYALNHGLERLK